MKALRILFSLFVVALLFGGCTYNFIVPEEVIDPGDPDAPEISFATEVQPIFNAKCVSCHKTGGQLPDLSSRYIDTNTPEASLIYTRPNPSNTGSHPKYSEAEAALVLTWITQGAKNN